MENKLYYALCWVSEDEAQTPPRHYSPTMLLVASDVGEHTPGSLAGDLGLTRLLEYRVTVRDLATRYPDPTAVTRMVPIE